MKRKKEQQGGVKTAVGLVQRFDVSWDAPISVNNLNR